MSMDLTDFDHLLYWINDQYTQCPTRENVPIPENSAIVDILLIISQTFLLLKERIFSFW